ncbi:MAG: type II toxin-antitoxin system VapC family toxin [Methylococcales bacterium]|nr:type II toxin-antitoxin system VapC family toxin [Methylococcales bacterium]
MNVVIDASVTIKWFVPDDGTEEDADKAIAVFKAIQQSSLNPIQPIHWQAEVIAVLSRIQVINCMQNIELLNILEFPVCDNLETYQLASRIASKSNHHLFDTLYHAVALNQQASLITADKKYYHKAKELGNIYLLTDYQL